LRLSSYKVRKPHKKKRKKVHANQRHLAPEVEVLHSNTEAKSDGNIADISVKPKRGRNTIDCDDKIPVSTTAACSNVDKRNNRLLAVAGVSGTNDVLEPVTGYAKEPLLSLAEACEPLAYLLHDVPFYVNMAVSETPDEPPDKLTVDESAAIRLYTIEWEKPHRSLYSMLNYTLKTAPRQELQPYFKYLKLFVTALAKLPCVPTTTVWRGVTKNLSAEFQNGSMVTWWAFSSCTTDLTVLENDMYLGTTGERTLFSIEAINGRTVQCHSHFVTEDEILLLPGTHMEVQSLFHPAPGLCIIHMKQIEPTQTLLELPFPGKSLTFIKCSSPVCLTHRCSIVSTTTIDSTLVQEKANNRRAEPSRYSLSHRNHRWYCAWHETLASSAR
jgi:hypothetical protein